MLSGSSHGRTVGTGVYLDLPTQILMIVDWKGNSQLEEQFPAGRAALVVR